jgi:type VI secretion system protein ImpI
MALTLKIEGQTSLQDGGPLCVSVQDKRGIDIGRDQYLDWTLPDPTRMISGKHCEIRWRDGGHWLHDISTNGTFLNGADHRLKEPHRIRDGDRFVIGHYVIAASVEDEPAGNSLQAQAQPPSYDELWEPVGEIAPPVDPKLLKSTHDFKPVRADFLQWAAEVPVTDGRSAPTGASQQPRRPAPPGEDMSWSLGTPRPPPPKKEEAPIPTPRRPVWVTGEPGGPWAPAAEIPAAPASAFSASESSPRVISQEISQDIGMETAAAPRAVHDAASAAQEHAPQDTTLGEFIRLMARGAGLPDDTLDSRDPAALAGEIGQLIRLFTENTRQMLEARQQTKRLARSSNQTMVQALNNNPLKFAPTAEEAMRIMFGQPTRSYLDARRAFTQSFDDLKSHQLKTISAMQNALGRLLAEFDPVQIEKTMKPDRGLATVFGSEKARLWDIYLTRWQARTQSNRDGLLNAFMSHFAEYYDLDGNGTP